VYRGRPIFYSVGNFLFEEPRAFMAPESVIVQARFGGRLAIALVPALLDAAGFPERAAGSAAARVLGHLADLSKTFGTSIEVEGDRARLVLE